MTEMTIQEGFRELKKMVGPIDRTEILPNHATYSDPMNGLDIRPELRKNMLARTGDAFAKAANIGTAASGTTDYALIPLYVDPSIIDLTRRLTPLVELIPRVTNYGRTAEFNQLTARGILGYRFEDASLAEQDDTYVRNSVAMAYQYQVGRVTGPYQAATKQYLSQNYVDALNLEVMNKSKSARFSEEDALLNGIHSTTRTAYGGATTISGAEFNGVINTTSIQTQAAGSTTVTIAGANTGLRDAIRSARTANASATLGQGNPDMMVTDFKTLDDIKALLQDYQRIVPSDKIAWGFQTVVFEGLPIIPSRFSPTGSNVKVISIMDSSTWQNRILQDLTYEELAKTNDSYKFMIKLYHALICTAPQFNCTITGLA